MPVLSHPTATKNAALNGITITHASLHSAYPGVTGANEISGGSYARKAVTINGASGGQRLQNASVAFDVPTDVRQHSMTRRGETDVVSPLAAGDETEGCRGRDVEEVLEPTTHDVFDERRDGRRECVVGGLVPCGRQHVGR